MIIASMHKKVTMILFLAFISDLIKIVIIYKWLCRDHVLHTDRIWVLITIRQYNKLRGLGILFCSRIILLGNVASGFVSMLVVL